MVLFPSARYLLVLDMKALITGGAGFIGSSLVDKLASQGNDAIVLDNLSAGSKENLSQSLNNGHVKLMLGDCTKSSDVKKALKDIDAVFHLAANPEVRLEQNDPEKCFKQNIYATHVLLENLRMSDTRTLVFASTSTVYGDAEVMPTPEEYPTRPISLYGSSKLASEALIMSYGNTYGFKTVILRLANVVGPRSNHGVIHDFVMKLKRNPDELEILGDGRQEKSYLYIDDCVDAFLLTSQLNEMKPIILNVGSEDRMDVGTIAKTVIEEMGLSGMRLRFTGGLDGRGWIGDVRTMLLDVSKLKSFGWRPKYNSQEAVHLTVKRKLKSVVL